MLMPAASAALWLAGRSPNRRFSKTDELCRIPGQGVVDFMGHACCQAAHGKHLLTLDHHLFQAQPFGHIVRPDHRTFNTIGNQWENGHIFITGLMLLFMRNLQIPEHPKVTDSGLDVGYFSHLTGEYVRQGPGLCICHAYLSDLLRLVVPLGHLTLAVHANQH